MWKKAHSRASDRESTEDKAHRRGNAVADIVANAGRMLYTDISDKLRKVKPLEVITKSWITWIGTAASLQLDDAFDGCDHTIVGKRSRMKPGRAALYPSIPKEASFIRRFPWASRSLGAQEHVCDLHCILARRCF